MPSPFARVDGAFQLSDAERSKIPDGEPCATPSLLELPDESPPHPVITTPTKNAAIHFCDILMTRFIVFFTNTSSIWEIIQSGGEYRCEWHHHTSYKTVNFSTRNGNKIAKCLKTLGSAGKFLPNAPTLSDAFDTKALDLKQANGRELQKGRKMCGRNSVLKQAKQTQKSRSKTGFL